MDPLLVILLSMVFATVVLGAYSAWFYIRSRDDAEEERLRRRLGTSEEFQSEELRQIIRDDRGDTIADILGRIGDDLEDTIQAAGANITVTALVFRSVLVFSVVGLGGFIMIGAPAIVPAATAAYVPFYLINRKATTRAKELLSQMPDALELMGRAMQAGTGLSECFRLVQVEMSMPISGEWGRVYEEIRFGKDWRDTLNQLVQRNPTLFDLRLFVSSVLLQRETGGNMIETVNRISKMIRERYVFDAKVRAMTSEARASGFILGAMPIAVGFLVFVANPGYLSPLYTSSFGQIVMVYCVASYGFGIMMMQSTSRVEV